MVGGISLIWAIPTKSSVAQSKVDLGWFSQLAARTSDEPVVRMD